MEWESITVFSILSTWPNHVFNRNTIVSSCKDHKLFLSLVDIFEWWTYMLWGTAQLLRKRFKGGTSLTGRETVDRSKLTLIDISHCLDGNVSWKAIANLRATDNEIEWRTGEGQLGINWQCGQPQHSRRARLKAIFWQTPFRKFGTCEARNVEFGTWINLGKSYLTHDKIPAKGAWLDPGAKFLNFGTACIYLDWVKLDF